MTPIRRSLKYGLEKRKNKTDNLPIRLRVSYLGNRYDFYSGYNADLKAWNNDRVKSGFTSKSGHTFSEINGQLFTIKQNVNNVFKLHELQDTLPDKEDIRNAIGLNSNTTEEVIEEEIVTQINFFEVFDEFVKVNGKLNNWTLNTFKKFSSVKNHLENFNSELSFEAFNHEGLTDYLDYLRKVKKMRNSTIKKQLSYLKWFLRWSVKNDYTKVDDFKNYQPKFKSSNKKVIFLTDDDKKKITSLKLSSNKQYLERVRDVLMFSCYTGLRYSDIYNLKKSDVKDNTIEVTTVKTSDNLIIELNKYSKAILEKYADIPFKNDKALPVISNQKMNDYLKELAELAEINESIRLTHYEGNKRIDNIYPKYSLVSTHIGRRTFIITALTIGIPVQVVMKWTGHTDYQSMKPYIDIADKTKKSEMKKFDMI